MSTSLLLNFNGTNGSTTFVDEGPFNHTVTAVGNAQLSTTSPPFGSASLRLDGTGDRATVPLHSSLQLVGGQFTVEGFVNLDAGAGSDKIIIGMWGTQISWTLVLVATTRKLGFYYSTNGSTGTFTPKTTGAIALSTLTHVAATRDGSGNLRLFIGGVKGYDAVHSGTFFTTTTTGLGIGGQHNGGGEMPACYMDMFRIKKDECLYTADFTPPSVEFTEPRTVAAPPRAFPRSILRF